MAFTALNGVPTQVTYFGYPTWRLNYIRPMFALYGQDQWTLQRVTMNFGMRYDYFRAGYPDQYVAPTLWVPLERLAPGRVAVGWHDLSPRLGLAYDLFGNAKTALKLSAGRYVLADGTFAANAVNPITANNSDTRRWTDLNGDRILQGDPINSAANGELGPSTNLSFGKPESSVEYDPDRAFGFGKRPYNWEFSAAIQHELLPRVSVSAGYFRRVYGNFDATINQAVTAADFDPYCVTTPVDSRLPQGGGQQICGLYDQGRNVGLRQRVTLNASNLGEQYEHWNGFDVTVQARLAKVLLQGGLSTGKTTTDDCAIVGSRPEFAVTRPAQFCHVETPLTAQTQVKLLGTYMLPWDVQFAGTFQHLPGPEDLANATYTSAQIAPSLGRPLAAASTVRVPIVAPATLYGPRLNQFDLRFGKIFRFQGAQLNGMIDLYNAFNSNVVTTRSSTYGATTGATAGAAWLRPGAILPARVIKFSVHAEF